MQYSIGHSAAEVSAATLPTPSACLPRQVEAGMVESVRESCAQGVLSYPSVPREQWVMQWPGQVVLVVTGIFWTQVRRPA